MAVLTLLCAALLLPSLVRGASVEAQAAAHLLSRLEQFCKAECNQRLAPEDGRTCTLFCEFVNHLRLAHESEVYDLYRNSGYHIEPLVWAMNDVVQEKLRAKLDDDHMIGELFFRKANEWYSLGKHRDEL